MCLGRDLFKCVHEFIKGRGNVQDIQIVTCGQTEIQIHTPTHTHKQKSKHTHTHTHTHTPLHLSGLYTSPRRLCPFQLSNTSGVQHPRQLLPLNAPGYNAKILQITSIVGNGEEKLDEVQHRKSHDKYYKMFSNNEVCQVLESSQQEM